MKYNLQLAIPLLTLLIGSAGGYFLGQEKSHSSTGTTASPSELSSRSSTRSPDQTDSATKGNRRKTESLASILALPSQMQRVQAMMDFYAGLSPTELEEEARKLESLPMPERIMASYLLFAKWAETDPLNALAFSDKLGFTGMFAKPTIMQSWASVDPVNAAKFYQENPGQFAMMGMFGGRGPMGGSAASIIAGEWAKQDPNAAMAWAKKLNSGEKGNAINSIIQQVAQQDSEKAIALAAGLEGEEKQRAHQQIAEAMGGNWDKALSYIATLPTDEQAEAKRKAFEGLSKSNPERALSELSGFADGDARNSATRIVLGELSKEQPQQAFDYIISTGAEKNSESIRPVMMNYARQDSAGAMAAIGKLPEGETRDRAIATYSFASTSTDYANGFNLAASIGDDEERQRALAVTSAKWMTSDPEAAKAAINQSTALSDEQKTRLLENSRDGMRFGRGFRND